LVVQEVVDGLSYGQAADWWSLGALIFECLTGLPPFHASSPCGVFENIRSGDIRWPESAEISPEAKDLVQRLLNVDSERRLCDMDEVRRHAFFHGLDWDQIFCSNGPFTPQLESEIDTSYFYDLKGPATVCMAEDCLHPEDNSSGPTGHKAVALQKSALQLTQM